MQYSDIKLFADDLIDTDDVKFPLDRKVRYANRAYESIVAKILNADGRVLFDDFNFSTTPIGTGALTSGVRSYKVRYDEYGNSILRLVKLMVEDSNGEYHDCKQVDVRSPEGETIRNGGGGTGTPSKYVRLGSSIIFDVAPDYSSATGQRYVYQRTFDPFIQADTTKEPGFAPQFHMLIPLWMAYWEGMKRGKQQITTIRADIAALEAELLEFYQNIDMADETVVTTATDDPR